MGEVKWKVEIGWKIWPMVKFVVVVVVVLVAINSNCVAVIHGVGSN
jgi:hypothetical protein